MGAVAVQDQVNLKWLDDGQHPLDWHGPTNRSFTAFRDEDLELPIIAHLERVVRRYPKRVAVTDSDTSLSFTQLWDGLSGLAEQIEFETKPGDLIGIMLPMSSTFSIAILACLAAGRAFVPLDPHYPSEWLRQVLEEARPALIIGQEDVFTRLQRPVGKSWRPAEHGVDQPACVLFTSGSTGRPKGIVNSQRGLLQRAAQSINAAHINAEDRFLTLSSLSTIVGLRDAITALLAGASVHVLDPQSTGAREVLNIIRVEAITVLFAFPALLRSLTGCAREPAGDTLRLVRVGGDTTLWSDIDRLRGWLAPGTAIQSIYAATEAPMMQWFVDDSCRADDPRIPIGYPLPGNRLAVSDEHGNDTPAGDVGELMVASPHVALGIWADGHWLPGSIEAVESAGAAACRMFRTGDLVRQRPDGLLERLGRKDRQVKIRGTRVDLDGVEAVLRKHPLVRDAAALARTSGAGEATLVAYVSARDEAPGLLDDLKDLMRAAPPPMRPARLYLTRDVPRLPGSKLDVRSLAALDEATVQSERANVAAAAVSVRADSDRITRTVARIWQELLQAPLRGPEDDFFEAGGDSLKALTFVMELEQALDLELSLTVITEAPTFARLCQVLREHNATGYFPLVPLKAGAGVPPLFFVHDVGGSVAGLFPVARRMTYSGAVIGIQARGLARQEPPHTSVEAMAAEYLREVKRWQPEGPYYLCGYSFGGLVAFEMARRLCQSGDKVGLVGLFDTTMSARRWPFRCWLSFLRGRIVQFGAGGRGGSIPARAGTVWRVVRGLYEELRTYTTPIAPDGQPLPKFLKSAPRRVLRVGASALIASARYRPGFYPGEVTLFTAGEREQGVPSLEEIWSKHAQALRIVKTAGTHSTMLSAANAQAAASLLTRVLPAMKPAS